VSSRTNRADPQGAFARQADRLAKELVDLIIRRHPEFRDRPAWIATLEFREIELELARRQEQALGDAFNWGYDERGFAIEDDGVGQ
jgi:hypothetical protein